MKKTTLIHPRELHTAINNFLLQVLTTENITHITKYKCQDGHIAYKNLPATPKLTKIPGYLNFGVNCYDFFSDYNVSNKVKFVYSPDFFIHPSSRDYEKGTGFVMADMVHRASYMRGFSQAVRILLHELGHIMTYKEIFSEYTFREIYDMRANCRSNKDYIRLPDEYAATQWAIDWLANPDHRKIARDFEKKFWTCFA